jgi:hypothetical protein
VRRLAVFAVLALVVAGCGGSGGSRPSTAPVRITFGLSGGTMIPFAATIDRAGTVQTAGFLPGAVVAKTVSRAQEKTLSGLVREAIGGLKDEQCSDSFPDESGKFITALGKTVTVRGTCEPSFTKLWNELANAIGVKQ